VAQELSEVAVDLEVFRVLLTPRDAAPAILPRGNTGMKLNELFNPPKALVLGNYNS